MEKTPLLVQLLVWVVAMVVLMLRPVIPVDPAEEADLARAAREQLQEVLVQQDKDTPAEPVALTVRAILRAEVVEPALSVRQL